MATIVGGILGAAAGSVLPGVGWQLGWSLGTTLGSMLDQPSSKIAQGRLSDLKASGSSYGNIIPQVWGTAKIGGNLIWNEEDMYGNHLIEHENDIKSGGKGSGGTTVQNYSYTTTIAVAVCQGTLVAPDGTLINHNTRITRIYANDVCIWDAGSATIDPTTGIRRYPKPTFYNSYNYGSEPAISDPGSAVEETTGTQYTGTSKIFIYRGTETQERCSRMTATDAECPAYRGLVYFVLEDYDLTTLFGNGIPQFQVEVCTDPISLETFSTDLCLMTGVASEDMDFSDGSGVFITGYANALRTDVQSILSPVLSLYLFDMYEVDGLLKIRQRGDGITGTVSPGDLGAFIASTAEPQTDSPLVQEIRTQDTELPGYMDITYMSVDKDLEVGVQSAVLQTKNIDNQTNLSFSIALTDLDAKAKIAAQLDTAWEERNAFSFSLPYKYLIYSPTDLLTLPVRNENVRVRIIGMEIGLMGELRCDAVRDSPYVLVQTAPSSGSPSRGSSPSALVPTTFAAWSGPELRDSDQDQVGFYVAATGDAGWPGAVCYWSSDDGATWQNGTTLSQRSVFGTTTSALSGAGAVANTFDSTNTVGVSVNGALATTTEADVNNGSNIAVIGTEIVGFATATLVSTGIYTLSELLRGLRASSGNMAGHASGEQFIYCNPSSVQRVTVPAALSGQTIKVVVISFGQLITDGIPVDIVIFPRTPTAIETTVGTTSDDLAALEAEILASHTSTFFGETFSTIGHRLDDIESDIADFTSGGFTASDGTTDYTGITKIIFNGGTLTLVSPGVVEYTLPSGGTSLPIDTGDVG